METKRKPIFVSAEGGGVVTLFKQPHQMLRTWNPTHECLGPTMGFSHRASPVWGFATETRSQIVQGETSGLTSKLWCPRKAKSSCKGANP